MPYFVFRKVPVSSELSKLFPYAQPLASWVHASSLNSLNLFLCLPTCIAYLESRHKSLLRKLTLRKSEPALSSFPLLYGGQVPVRIQHVACLWKLSFIGVTVWHKSHLFIHLLCAAAFLLQQLCLIIWPSKPKIFILWPFTDVDDPCFEAGLCDYEAEKSHKFAWEVKVQEIWCYISSPNAKAI